MWQVTTWTVLGPVLGTLSQLSSIQMLIEPLWVRALLISLGLPEMTVYDPPTYRYLCQAKPRLSELRSSW
jgi:hypothetical protein